MEFIKYTGTLSNGAKQTTTSANQVISLSQAYISTHSGAPADFVVSATNLTVYNFAATAIHIQLNNETTVHEIDANSSINFSDIVITQFTIQENAVSYRWSAMY